MEEQYQLHLLAESRAGHDTGKIYVVVGEDGDFVYLSDGRLKTLQKCKKKNRKHVQLIRHLQSGDTFPHEIGSAGRLQTAI